MHNHSVTQSYSVTQSPNGGPYLCYYLMKHLFRLTAALSLSGFALATNPVLAQTITVDNSQLNFGTATETAPQGRTLTLTNPTAEPVAVQAHTFAFYGQPAFTATPAAFTIPAGGTQAVTVTFSPLHNVAHNAELVFETNRNGAVSIDLRGQGAYSKAYYNATQNLSQQALMGALKTITTTGHNALGYDTGRDRMFMVIDNQRVNGQGASTNTLECIYTARVITGFSSRSQAQSRNFNTEHTWPQSQFGSASPMVSDIHHLFPTDNDANNSRSSYPFGVATTPYRNDAINTPSHLGANNFYEPRDPQKGRTARAMMYFVTRYQNYTGFFNPQQNTLRRWSKQFPVTAVDRKRNDDVQTAQGNRNPFVDYPQLVDRISNFVGNPSVAPDSVAVYRSNADIAFGTITQAQTYSYVLVNSSTQPLNLTSAVAATAIAGVTLSVTPTTGTVAPGDAVTLNVRLDPGTVTGPITGTLTLVSTFPAPNNGVVVPITANVGPTAAPQPLTAPTARLDVYPNPATEELTVVSPAATPLTLTDALGREVRRVATPDALTVLDLRGLPAGLYVVRAGSRSHRVVVR